MRLSEDVIRYLTVKQEGPLPTPRSSNSGGSNKTDNKTDNKADNKADENKDPSNLKESQTKNLILKKITRKFCLKKLHQQNQKSPNLKIYN